MKFSLNLYLPIWVLILIGILFIIFFIYFHYNIFPKILNKILFKDINTIRMTFLTFIKDSYDIAKVFGNTRKDYFYALSADIETIKSPLDINRQIPFAISLACYKDNRIRKKRDIPDSNWNKLC